MAQLQDVCALCKARPAPHCVRVDQQQSAAVSQSAARAKHLQRDPAGGEIAPQRDQLQGGVFACQGWGLNFKSHVHTHKCFSFFPCLCVDVLGWKWHLSQAEWPGLGRCSLQRGSGSLRAESGPRDGGSHAGEALKIHCFLVIFLRIFYSYFCKIRLAEVMYGVFWKGLENLGDEKGDFARLLAKQAGLIGKLFIQIEICVNIFYLLFL